MANHEQKLDKEVQKVFNSLPKNKQGLISSGMYRADEYFANEMADFLGFNDYSEDDTPDSQTSINGQWDDIDGRWDGLDNFQDSLEDIEYHNLFRKSGRKKLSKGFKKITKKATLKNIGKGVKKITKKITIKNIGKGIKKAAKFIKKIGMAVIGAAPRNAFLGLVALNFRGLAYKLNYKKENDKKNWDKICKKWEQWGGLSCKPVAKNVATGKNKKMLFCGPKCKAKLPMKKFIGFDGRVNYKVDKERLYEQVNNFNFMSNIEPATATAVMVGLGGALISSIAPLLTNIPQNKAMKEQIKNQKEKDKEEIKLMAKQQGVSEMQVKKELELAEKKINDELNPINQIVNNPNLSKKEKEEAIAQVNKALDTKETRSNKKYILWAVIGIAVLFVGAKLLAKKN
jgi:hypothetical protein